MSSLDHQSLAAIARRLAEALLAGAREDALLDAFSRQLVAAGVPLARAVLGADTLHPVLEGRVFEWRAGEPAVKQVDYGRSATAGEDQRWLRSPFYALWTSHEGLLRRRLVGPEARLDFPVLEDLVGQGITDYVAMITRFGEQAAIGQLDSIYSSWSTDRPEGFDDAHVAALEFLMPTLAAMIKSAATRRIAVTIAETYLGHDAARRVLGGTIARGAVERMDAALWLSDLRGFTRLIDAHSPAAVIPLLNEYADAVVSAVHANGGQVLKFMGDGVLAIFADAGTSPGCAQALSAARMALAEVDALTRRRASAGAPVAEVYLGLHVGEVFYGNIGSSERLDFTVIGPAVNELARIAAMCKSLERPVVTSAVFAERCGPAASQLVSLGRYALRGIERPQELFTVDPAAGPPAP